MNWHKYLVFALDGTGHSAGSLLQPFGGLLGAPAARSHGDIGPSLPGQWNTYIVPADDQHAPHWLRMMGESRIASDLAHRQAGHGKPSAARHAGGVAHPTLAHIRLGGTITWESPAPHPLVQEHMDWLAAMRIEEMMRHLCGPSVFDRGSYPT